MGQVVEKICVVCGKDVSGGKRVKDLAGRYYCPPCAEVAEMRAGPTTAGGGERELATVAGKGADDGVFDLAPVVEAPKAPPKYVTVPKIKELGSVVAPVFEAGGPVCPSCGKALTKGAKFCTMCGIKVPSGRPLITALGRDEDALHGTAEAIIRPLSWLLRFGLYPIASEAYATKKPIATWVIAIVTVICSLIFFGVMCTEGEHEGAKQLMLWHKKQNVSDADLLALFRRHEKDEAGAVIEALANDPDNPMPGKTEDERIVAVMRQVGIGIQDGDFRWYQLFTNTFLHDYGSIFGLIMHLGGNMLFLLIFGTRVNALIGNTKMAIVYPLLGAAASGAQLLFDKTTLPALGASGAIMGLAGMYLIFFPVHRMYMAIWFKLFWGVPTWIKIWAARSFWVIGFYLSFDVVATLLLGEDGVAHWAHLGGFVVGAVVAVAMLVTRVQSANHGDLISVVLGKWSWPLIGKPVGAAYAGVTRF